MSLSRLVTCSISGLRLGLRLCLPLGACVALGLGLCVGVVLVVVVVMVVVVVAVVGVVGVVVLGADEGRVVRVDVVALAAVSLRIKDGCEFSNLT